ncbi:MAG: DUF1850 domain-containing protein [Peptococcaceae bacterium]|nr:DUF1850 domain-containing protein [Peptococcaceae bacterium]
MFFVLIVAVVVGAVFYFMTPVYYLDVTVGDEGEVVYHERVNPGDRFTHSYLHSVALQPVYETFEVGNDYNLYLVETGFGSLGAGLPYEDKGQFSIENGMYVLRDLKQPVDAVYLRGSSFTNHKLKIDNKVFNLSSKSFCGLRVEVKVRARARARASRLF